MTEEGLQICFFCARNTIDFAQQGRWDMIRKYLRMESVCPECEAHWTKRADDMEKKADERLAAADRFDNKNDYRSKKGRK